MARAKPEERLFVHYRYCKASRYWGTPATPWRLVYAGTEWECWEFIGEFMSAMLAGRCELRRANGKGFRGQSFKRYFAEVEESLGL